MGGGASKEAPSAAIIVTDVPAEESANIAEAEIIESNTTPTPIETAPDYASTSTSSSAKRLSFFGSNSPPSPKATKLVPPVEIPSVYAELPDDVTGEDVVWLMRKKLGSPWLNAVPPDEDVYPDNYSAPSTAVTKATSPTGTTRRTGARAYAGSKHYQYMTWWDASHKGWSVVLEEEGQPPKPITGGYHAAYLASKHSEWNPLLSQPLLARCPGGTGNPGGWVRGVHPLPRSGRHYWEVLYAQAGDELPRGSPLEGTMLTGLCNNQRQLFEWNSGISDFWGLSSGPWRRRGADAVVILGGEVVDLELYGEDDFDFEEEALNASGVVHGQGERVGVLVDMDKGWLAFFREGRPIAFIEATDFPMLEYEWWPCCRPFVPGSTAMLDCHCPVPPAALRMTGPGESSDDSDDDSSSYGTSSSSSGSSSSSSSGSSSSGSSDTSSSRGSSSSGSGGSSSTGANSSTAFSFVPPSNSSLSVRSTQPKLRRSATPS